MGHRSYSMSHLHVNSILLSTFFQQKKDCFHALPFFERGPNVEKEFSNKSLIYIVPFFSSFVNTNKDLTPHALSVIILFKSALLLYPYKFMGLFLKRKKKLLRYCQSKEFFFFIYYNTLLKKLCNLSFFGFSKNSFGSFSS